MLQPPSFPVPAIQRALAALAEQNVFIGTSSWKYPGWTGLLYDEQRYLYRGKFAESRFERDCLEEYAQVFRAVCVDAGYYKFPSPEYIAKLCAQVPDGFRFAFKVTDEITARTFPSQPRHGKMAGQRNPHFLDADLFRAAFLASCERHREKIGVLMFEFSHFHPRDFDRGRDFVEMLDTFFSQLPPGWQYGVEIRNQTLLHPDYFTVLQRHGVAHVMNNWTRMPAVADQWRIPGVLSAGDFTAARFLLKPGRGYEQAVQSFSPYNATKEVNEDARAAAAEVIRQRLNDAQRGKTRPSFLFVNNRLEGNALFTILAVLTNLGLIEPPKAPPAT
jgi:uncharacterized protein YecE (DUF72 family)